MTGREHYAEAEQLLVEATDAVDSSSADSLVARAQVHATLALAHEVRRSR